MAIINNFINAFADFVSSPIAGELLRILMLAGVFLCACHSAAKHAIINTRDEYARLGRMARKGAKPKWNGTQWRKYYYIKAIVLVALLLVVELWAAIRAKYLALGIVVVALLMYLDHKMITWLEATSGAVYDNHRNGRIVKIKSLHISVYPRALFWMIPVTIIGMVLIFAIDVLLIFLFAAIIFGLK